MMSEQQAIVDVPDTPASPDVEQEREDSSESTTSDSVVIPSLISTSQHTTTTLTGTDQVYNLPSRKSFAEEWDKGERQERAARELASREGHQGTASLGLLPGPREVSTEPDVPWPNRYIPQRRSRNTNMFPAFRRPGNMQPPHHAMNYYLMTPQYPPLMFPFSGGPCYYADFCLEGHG